MRQWGSSQDGATVLPRFGSGWCDGRGRHEHGSRWAAMRSVDENIGAPRSLCARRWSAWSVTKAPTARLRGLSRGLTAAASRKDALGAKRGGAPDAARQVQCVEDCPVHQHGDRCVQAVSSLRWGYPHGCPQTHRLLLTGIVNRPVVPSNTIVGQECRSLDGETMGHVSRVSRSQR